MSTAKPNVHSVQDLPPKGGYPPIATARGLRPRGPPGWAIWLGILSASAYGFYQIGVTNENKRFLLKEKRDSRMAIYPFLQVESDKRISSSIKYSLEKETEIMKHNPDWKVGESVYSKRWNPPSNRI
mmetsp:Transcript_13813/g.18889  ORF Transcript_13813/g.18889 Transcript_13813/m.18889 type:complete len:127 (+) Transcript_13813:37-417(+)